MQVQEAHCRREGQCSDYCVSKTLGDLHEHAVEDREQRSLRFCIAGCLSAILWLQANFLVFKSILLGLLLKLWPWIWKFWQDLLREAVERNRDLEDQTFSERVWASKDRFGQNPIGNYKEHETNRLHQLLRYTNSNWGFGVGPRQILQSNLWCYCWSCLWQSLCIQGLQSGSAKWLGGCHWETLMVQLTEEFPLLCSLVGHNFGGKPLGTVRQSHVHFSLATITTTMSTLVRQRLMRWAVCLERKLIWELKM